MFMAFSVAIMCFFMVLQGIENSQQGNVFSDDDRILVVSNGIAPRYPLPVRYANEIMQSSIPGVEHAAAVNFVPATISGTRKQIAALAANPTDLLRTNTDIVVLGGSTDRWIEDRNGVLVGRDFAEREKLMVGDTLPISSPSFRIAGGEGTQRLQIKGMYAVKDDAYPAVGVLMHESLIRPMGQLTASQGANGILVLVSHRQEATTVSRMIDERYATAAVSTRTSLREQFVEAFNDQGAGIAALMWLYGMGGIVTGVMLLAIFCYFNAHRLQETWGRLDEMGFKRGQMIGGASMAMTSLILLSTAFGIIITLVGYEMFKVAIKQSFPYFHISPTSAFLILPAVVGITFVFSVLSLITITRGSIGVTPQESA